MVPEAVVEEILQRNDIESLIGSYVSLKRAGSNLKGLCPFHNEKSPSFTVYPANNSFYCFGCGVGGTAITFIRQIEHLDYPDALQFLAKRAGIHIDLDDRPDAGQTKRYNKDRFYKMNTDAARFFHKSLFADNEKARAALAYFTEKRRLSLATIKHFGLGFAPDDFNTFGNYMRSLGYQNDELVAGFLLGKSENGRYFDAFRNRVMFPILDVAGNVIAFGGRVMDDSKPKYKNSSDTPVFKKTRNLFALNFAHNVCAETMILCEGYMDVIAMHAAGFTNAVATLGTAMTTDQARLMSRYTKKIIIAYDADEAGQKAAKRAIGMFDEVGLEATVLKIPGAKDPDEYIRENGADKFRTVLEGSKSKFDYNMDSILSKYEIALPQERINALGELVKLIAGFRSSAERDVYIQAVSKQLSVPAEGIRVDVERLVKAAARDRMRGEEQSVKQKLAGFSDKVNPDFVKAPAVARHEETVLGLLLLYPEHRKLVATENLLCEEDFFTALGKHVFRFIFDRYAEGEDPDHGLDGEFSAEEVGRITKMKLARMQLTDNGKTVLTDAIRALKGAMEKQSSREISSFDQLNSLINAKRNEQK